MTTNRRLIQKSYGTKPQVDYSNNALIEQYTKANNADKLNIAKKTTTSNCFFVQVLWNFYCSCVKNNTYETRGAFCNQVPTVCGVFMAGLTAIKYTINKIHLQY